MMNIKVPFKKYTYLVTRNLGIRSMLGLKSFGGAYMMIEYRTESLSIKQTIFHLLFFCRCLNRKNLDKK